MLEIDVTYLPPYISIDHSHYRVIGSLVNSPDFANAFKCSKDSHMNPQEKCVMW